ncbi:MAG: PKD domain-containing protein, partial [Planctomycetota bacterium]
AVDGGSSHSVALLEEPPTGHPIANAGNDIIAGANEQITLDASNSIDLDGQIVLYTWKRLPDEVVIYSGSEPIYQTRTLGRAEEVIELSVTDNDSLIGSDTLIIINRILKDLQDRLDGMQVSDLNQDRKVNMIDLALLVENWLR